MIQVVQYTVDWSSVHLSAYMAGWECKTVVGRSNVVHQYNRGYSFACSIVANDVVDVANDVVDVAGDVVDVAGDVVNDVFAVVVVVVAEVERIVIGSNLTLGTPIKK